MLLNLIKKINLFSNSQLKNLIIEGDILWTWVFHHFRVYSENGYISIIASWDLGAPRLATPDLLHMKQE